MSDILHFQNPSPNAAARGKSTPPLMLVGDVNTNSTSFYTCINVLTPVEGMNKGDFPNYNNKIISPEYQYNYRIYEESE